MKIYLFLFFLLLKGIEAVAQASNPNGGSLICCERNLLKNGALVGDCTATGSDISGRCLLDWQEKSLSPQLITSFGYTTPCFASMWGTTTPNESIGQNVPFTNGYRYQISCAIRKPKPIAAKNHKDGVRFRFFVGSTLVGETFELFYTTTSDWVYVTLPEFTYNGPTGMQAFSLGAISGVVDIAAFGDIDDICLQVLPPCEKLLAASIFGPTTICEGSAAAYSVPNVAGATYSWSIVPGVVFSGNGTNAINIPGSSTMGKTQLTITAKIKCGGKEVIKTIVVKILKKITDPGFSLVATTISGSTGVSANATPVVGSPYLHQWTLYESNLPFTNCNTPFPSGTILKSFTNTINFTHSSLVQDKHYLLRHAVQNCDGSWLVQNQCFRIGKDARVKPGTNQWPLDLTKSADKTLSDAEFEAEIMDMELKKRN